jgi:hypothetical protein
MTITTTNDLQNVEGHTAVDANGAKLGKIGRVYVDDTSGQPLWVTISTGMFGMKESFAPLYGSRAEGGTLRLAVTKDMVKGAPGVETDGRIQHDENMALHTYYEGYLGGSVQDAPARDEGQWYAGDTSGSTADAAMTRPQERLHVVTGDHQASETLPTRPIDPGTTR